MERCRLEALLSTIVDVEPTAYGYFDDFFGGDADDAPAVIDRVAVIPVCGLLVKSGDWYCRMMGWSSYEGIRGQIEKAIGDRGADAILLAIDSPGGETGGLFDLVDWIRAQRESKPIHAVANEMAFSAAYAIASSAERITLPVTGGLGSIGVLFEHVDLSGADARFGVAFEPIFAGARKNDFTEHEPLSDPARAVMRTEIDRLYGLFVTAVSTGRNLPAQTVRDTEAGLFFGPDAVASRLADAVGTYDDAFSAAMAAGEQASAMQATRPTAREKEDDLMPGLNVRHTATSAAAWDEKKHRERLAPQESPLAAAHAWRSPKGEPASAGSYAVLHHEISSEGVVGAANVTACLSAIAAMNGGTIDLPDEDRAAVHAHLAAHLKDAGKEAPALVSAAKAQVAKARAALRAAKDQLEKSEADTDEHLDEDEDELEETETDTDEHLDEDEEGLEDSPADTSKGKAKGKAMPKKKTAAVVDLDAERKKIRGDTRAEAVEIVNLCKLAGIPSFAAELLAEEGMTLALARTRLEARRAGCADDEIHGAGGEPSLQDRYAKPFSAAASFSRYGGPFEQRSPQTATQATAQRRPSA